VLPNDRQQREFCKQRITAAQVEFRFPDCLALSNRWPVTEPGACSSCTSSSEELEAAKAHITELEAQLAEFLESSEKLDAAKARIVELEAQLAEFIKLCELQQKDLERYEKAVADLKPHCPERVPREQLQMALAQVLSTADAATVEAANDVFVETAPDADARGDEDSDNAASVACSSTADMASTCGHSTSCMKLRGTRKHTFVIRCRGLRYGSTPIRWHQPTKTRCATVEGIEISNSLSASRSR
jgi:hypothetical protein